MKSTCLYWVHSSLTFRGGLVSKIPRQKRKSANNWQSYPPPPKRLFWYFFSVFFSLHKHCDESCLFFPFSSNTTQWGSKTCSNCWTVLMLLATERSQEHIFILDAAPRICETAKYQGMSVLKSVVPPPPSFRCTSRQTTRSPPLSPSTQLMTFLE